MRKTFIIILIGIAVLLAGYVGYRSYNVWRCNHLMNLAHQFLAKEDGRNAMLCAQRVLRIDPQNVAATRVMAQLASLANSPIALMYWSRVVELNPHSLDDRLGLADTAMKLRDYAAATNALGGVDPASRNTVAYHRAAGVVTYAIGDVAKSQAEFLEATKLDPQNLSLQLYLAMVRLHDTNQSGPSLARDTLRQLSVSATNPAIRCQALRVLVDDALRRRRSDEALSYSKQLSADTNNIFRDRLLRLEVLKKTASADLQPELASFQREAGTNLVKVFDLVQWQLDEGSPQEGLAWVRTLPPATQTNLALEYQVAECYDKLRDWRGLQSAIAPQNWGEYDFARHAYLSRALRGQGLGDSAKAEWELALKGANAQYENTTKINLSKLLYLAGQWNWQSEGEEILWVIVNRYPGDRQAVRQLTQALFVSGRTRSLMQLFSQESKRAPSDAEIKNNLAMTALLLDAQELKPYDLAHQAYQQYPTNATYASTYAFSLYLQGKNADALKIMTSLKTQDLQSTAIAGYYGLILKATGDREKARIYLDWACKGRLLPEERKLFDRARAGL